MQVYQVFRPCGVCVDRMEGTFLSVMRSHDSRNQLQSPTLCADSLYLKGVLILFVAAHSGQGHYLS